MCSCWDYKPKLRGKGGGGEISHPYLIVIYVRIHAQVHTHTHAAYTTSELAYLCFLILFGRPQTVLWGRRCAFKFNLIIGYKHIVYIILSNVCPFKIVDRYCSNCDQFAVCWSHDSVAFCFVLFCLFYIFILLKQSPVRYTWIALRMYPFLISSRFRVVELIQW